MQLKQGKVFERSAGGNAAPQQQQHPALSAGGNNAVAAGLFIGSNATFDNRNNDQSQQHQQQQRSPFVGGNASQQQQSNVNGLVLEQITFVCLGVNWFSMQRTIVFFTFCGESRPTFMQRMQPSDSGVSQQFDWTTAQQQQPQTKLPPVGTGAQRSGQPGGGQSQPVSSVDALQGQLGNLRVSGPASSGNTMTDGRQHMLQQQMRQQQPAQAGQFSG